MEVQKHQPRLWIIEDEPEILALLCEQVAPLGFEVRAISSAVEALSLVQELPTSQLPDAIISDISMPELSGLDFCREVQRLGLEIPFVFLTGFGETEQLSAAFHLGAYDFIKKPYDLPELLWTVAEAIEVGLQLHHSSTELQNGV